MPQGGLSGPLGDRRDAGERGVDHLADHVRQPRTGDRVADAPAAHAVRFAEGVSRHHLVKDAWLPEHGKMPAGPDHVAIGLVTKDGNITAAHQIGKVLQVFRGGHAAGRIMRRVEKDRAGARCFPEKVGNVVQIRAEFILLPKRTVDRPGAAAFNVRPIRRKVRTENQHRIPGVQKRLAEKLLKHFRARPHDNVGRGHLNAELAPVIGGDDLLELRKTGRGAVVRGVALDRPDTRRHGMARGRKGAVADLQLDDVLALRLETPGHGQHVKRRLCRESLSELAQCRSSLMHSGFSIRRECPNVTGRLGYCFAAMVCAKGRTTPGMMWLSTSSWHSLR